MRNYALWRDTSPVLRVQTRKPWLHLRFLVETFYNVRYPTEFTSTMSWEDSLKQFAWRWLGLPWQTPRLAHDALARFNVFARRFHHSNLDAQNEPLNEYELRQFARGAMSLIHDDRMSSMELVALDAISPRSSIVAAPARARRRTGGHS